MNPAWIQTIGLVSSVPNIKEEPSYPPLSSPIVQWEVDVTTDQNISTSVEYSAPAVSDEFVFIGLSHKEGVYIFDRHNGSSKGRLDTNSSVQSPPSIVGDKLVVSDISGTVYCWNIKSRELLWKVELKSPTNSKIIHSNGTMFVSTNNDLVYSISMEGELLWRFEHRIDPTRKGELKLFGSASPLVDEQSVYAGFSDGALIQLDRETGTIVSQVWNGSGRYPDIVSQPTKVGEGILVSAFEQPTWKQEKDNVVWEQEYGALHSSVALNSSKDGETYLYVHPGSDGVLRLIDITTGSAVWSWDSETESSLTTPVLLETGILIGSTNGTISVVDYENGNQYWTLQRDKQMGGMMHAPVVDDGQIFVLTKDGFLMALVGVTDDHYSCTDLFCDWWYSE
jgi:outer membrane protein assembly factor BamB